MDSVCRRFNIYLLAALSLLLVCGCASSSKKKKKDPELITSLRIHAQARANTTFTRKITLFENNPTTISVDQYPLFTDADVDSAQVVDSLGGFAIVIKFGKRGQWLLDEHSSIHLGEFLAIFAQYGEKKSEKSKWIAAPIISRRISDGALIFTPDVSREDAELIVKGLGKKTGLDKPQKEDKQWQQ